MTMTEIEQANYRYLNEHGYEALREHIGAANAHYITEYWINTKKVRFNRVTWEFHCYKKYL